MTKELEEKMNELAEHAFQETLLATGDKVWSIRVSDIYKEGFRAAMELKLEAVVSMHKSGADLLTFMGLYDELEEKQRLLDKALQNYERFKNG